MPGLDSSLSSQLPIGGNLSPVSDPYLRTTRRSSMIKTASHCLLATVLVLPGLLSAQAQEDPAGEFSELVEVTEVTE